MQEINIRIDSAKILGFSVELREDKPVVQAEFGLFSGEKKISTFHLHTSYDFDNYMRFVLPPAVVSSILEMAQELEYVLIRQTSKAIGQLPEAKVTRKRRGS
jgi:hypothetical protein